MKNNKVKRSIKLENMESNSIYDQIEKAKQQQQLQKENSTSVADVEEDLHLSNELKENIDDKTVIIKESESVNTFLEFEFPHREEIKFKCVNNEETQEKELFDYNKRIDNLISLNNGLKMQINFLQKKYEEEIKKIRSEKTRISLEKTATEEKLHTVMLQNRNNIENLSLAQSKEKELQNVVSNLKKQIIELTDEAKKKKEEHTYATIQLKQRLANEQQDLNTLLMENNQLKKKIDSIQIQCDSEVKKLSEALKNANKNTSMEKTSRIAYEKKVSIVEEQLAQLQQTLDLAKKNSVENYEVLKSESLLLERQLNEKKQEIEQQHKMLEAAREEIKNLKENISAIETANAIQNKEFEKLRVKVSVSNVSYNSPYEKTQFITDIEFKAYMILKKLCDGKNLNICVKVRLANIAEAKDNKTKWKDYIKYRYIDFLICNKNMYPVAAIDINTNVNNDVIKVQILDEIKIPFYMIFDEADIYKQVMFILQDIQNMNDEK